MALLSGKFYAKIILYQDLETFINIEQNTVSEKNIVSVKDLNLADTMRSSLYKSLNFSTTSKILNKQLIYLLGIYPNTSHNYTMFKLYK